LRNNMRIHLLAPLLGFSLIACAGQIDGGVGGDDDIEGCGDGIRTGDEACDDGNNIDGDGCSATCTIETVPRVTSSVDRQTIATELGKTEEITLTLQSVDGFTGPLGITAVVDYGVDPDGAWITAVDRPSVTLAADATEIVTIRVAVPTDTAGLTGSVNIDVTGAPEALTQSAAVTVANQYVLVIPAGTGANIPHANVGPINLRLRAGAKLIFSNQDTIAHRIHGPGGSFPHEEAGGGQPGGAYEVSPTQNATWYCHTHNEINARVYNVAVTQ
jgi:cysteine-rich repeat protein